VVDISVSDFDRGRSKNEGQVIPNPARFFNCLKHENTWLRPGYKKPQPSLLDFLNVLIHDRINFLKEETIKLESRICMLQSAPTNRKMNDIAQQFSEACDYADHLEECDLKFLLL